MKLLYFLVIKRMQSFECLMKKKSLLKKNYKNNKCIYKQCLLNKKYPFHFEKQKIQKEIKEEDEELVKMSKYIDKIIGMNFVLPEKQTLYFN